MALIAAQRLNADRPEARATLGNFYARRALTGEAENEYKAALRLVPQYVPAAINLADLYRHLGRDGDGESVLRTATASSRPDAGLHHALGLTLTRQKRPDDALAEFRAATEIEPDRSRGGSSARRLIFADQLFRTRLACASRMHRTWRRHLRCWSG